MTNITSDTLRIGLERIAMAAEGFAPELNAADGALGDGDLGITVSKGFMEAKNSALPADVGLAFMECAKAFQRVSSSSYGTLVATAFMSAAKACKGREAVPADEVPALLKGALDAMMARGKGQLGDKTVLDSLAAVEAALCDAPEGEMHATAVDTAKRTLEEFRQKPNKLGRARSYGERSVGLADPGQLALLRIVEGLAVG
ncbi:dihydroxyacetone kinase subunit L [Lichenihabitans sp. Uapishka_5]|uniref:dihydroxyacetone kinase subunit L n=1 Tax=Lichenihabitans sp. Uapishka_5 TaxID=3037302 RepID=UPI0029E7F6A4|nr:dihydroxyacetone kinase subunit L [Lichenihabitans sp. Uapishka_5]MDX7953489.1 dihydroxyacetone kinase subunit L [Lichenihabitans sp. Uapishka_5]